MRMRIQHSELGIRGAGRLTVRHCEERRDAAIHIYDEFVKMDCLADDRNNGSYTIAEQLAKAREQLSQVAGANAALEARLLAAHAWHMSTEDLVLRGNNMRREAPFSALIARRLTAEPVAQILGEKHFWKDVFRVNCKVLTPRADSETMIECLLRQRPDGKAAYRILDLGTGSGCLLLSALREYADATGVGVDQSVEALTVAARNAAILNLSPRCEMLRSNWCSNLTGIFDVVLVNPPYIPTADIAALDDDVRMYEPHAALDGGVDGINCYRRIIDELAPHVKTGTLLLFEVGIGQAEHVAALSAAAGWNVMEYATDLAGISRVVALEAN